MSLIYDLVVAMFLKLGLPAPTDICETLLVNDGCFIGHRFRCDGGYAIWGVGWKAVEFYDEEGQLLKRVAIKKTASLSA